MKCPNCGGECTDGVRFCTSCGTKLTDDAAGVACDLSERSDAVKPRPDGNITRYDSSTPNAVRGGLERKSASRLSFARYRYKKYFILVGVVLIIVVLAAVVAGIVSSVKNSSGYTQTTDTFYSESGSDGRLYDSHGGYYDLGEYDVGSYELVASLDGSVAAILGKSADGDATGSLLLINDSRLTKIADGVYDIAVSDNGASVAYAVAGEETGTLYIYNVKKQSASYVDGGILYSPISSGLLDTSGLDVMRGMFVLSPDGRSIAYTRRANGTMRAYVSVKGSEPVHISADAYPVALSNGGKYIYFIKRNISLTDYNYKLSVAVGDDIRHLCADAAKLGGNLIFNADRTEVLFCDDGITYVSRRGGERARIISGKIDGIVLPSEGAARRERFPFVGVSADIYARRNIGGSAFILNGGLYYLDGACEISVITSNYGGACIAPNGRSIYYIDTSVGADSYSGAVYYLEDISKNGSKHLVAGTMEASLILAADDMRGVYLLDIDDTLWYVTANGKTQKRICDEVVTVAVDSEGGGVWFTSAIEESGTVWYARRTDKKRSVVSADLARVRGGASFGGVVFFTLGDSADSGDYISVCRVRSGKKYDVITKYAVAQ